MPKQFRFDVLWLLSENERKARKITLAKKTTLLVGGNHTGKSTILRMLYYAFGCRTRPLGGEWSPRTIVAVTFSIDNVTYTILRRSSTFSLFDSEGILMWATNDAGDLRNHISSLLAFVLPLTSQQGESKQARPPFFFIPFFIDQDGSWGSTWQTFDSLAEFRAWQKPTIELMLGIRGSDYWAVYAEITKLKREMEDLLREKKVLANTRLRLSDKFPKKPWFRDALTFKQDLVVLEGRVSQLATTQQQLEAQRIDARSSQDTLKSQIGLIESALREHSADMRYLDSQPIDRSIICPTCGTTHEHSFHSRLNLEAEADDLRQLRAHFMLRLERIRGESESIEHEIAEVTEQSNEVNRLLESHRGELKLRDIVNRAGANAAHDALDQQDVLIASDLGSTERIAEGLEQQLEAMQNAERAKEITRRFRDLYGNFATLLDVPKSLRTHKGSVAQKPTSGGSGGPRAVLAYYFALAYTADEYSRECIPPLTIDSPHQQAQDDIKRPQVTEFIFRHSPPKQQLIVALEDPPPASVVLEDDDKRIDLKGEFSLLVTADFDEAFSFIEPMWRATEALLSSQKTLPF